MNAPLPLFGRSGVSLGLVVVYWRVPAIGDPTIAGYWDFAAGAFDATFDKTKHVRPLSRIGADGTSADFKLQATSVPKEPFEGFKACLFLYEIGPDGGLSDLDSVYGPDKSRSLVGL